MYYVNESSSGRIIPIGAAALEESAKRLVSDRLGIELADLVWESLDDRLQYASHKNRTFVCEDTSKNA